MDQGSKAARTVPPAPANQLVPAILTTILCFLPFGVVSIMYATQVDSKYRAGDYAGAQAASETAKKWWIAAIVAGVAIVIIYFVFIASLFSQIPDVPPPPEIPQAPELP